MLSEFRLYRYDFSEVCLTLEQICDFLKLDVSQSEHPAIVSIKEILSVLHNEKDIAGGYKVFPVEKLNIKEGHIQLLNNRLQLERQVCGYINHSEYVALFLCTAGNIFTEMAHDLNARGDILEAYLADAIGSLTVENAMDKIQERLEKEMLTKGMKITNRYSPGYCNWALSEQVPLFQLIGENPIGVSLTDSCLMKPIKSVSGIIGIGKNVRKREYGCVVCKNEFCIYRKLIEQKIKS